jgi:hypothetical protein
MWRMTLKIVLAKKVTQPFHAKHCICNKKRDAQNAECQLLLMANYGCSYAACYILGCCSLQQITLGNLTPAQKV